MAGKNPAGEHRCPGENYTISTAICRTRQLRGYPKCMICPERTGAAEVDVQGPKSSVNMQIFKSYDIRGTYPDELDEEVARKIGAATAQFLNTRELVVGRDMRTSGRSLAQAVSEGITSQGTDVIDIGLVSTETVYFAIGYYGYGGGLMVTASHNPAEYNGFKICREKAIPVSYDTGIANISQLILEERTAPRGEPGRVTQRDVLNDYKDHILTFVEDLKPLKLVVDAGNGMAGKMFPLVFRSLPCETTQMYFELDGSFPNHEPNPLKEENLADLKKRVMETGADLGVAFDGDADRVAFVDEEGHTAPSDLITALIAKKLLKKNPGATVIYDLRSSHVVPEEIEAAGGRPLEERVGHAHIKATMRNKDAVFGGELSGHYYFRDNFFADSGLIALIEVLNILSAANQPLSQLIAPLRRYWCTGEINFKVEDADRVLEAVENKFKDARISHLDGVTIEYDEWWCNVRKSNTEPLVRVTLEGKTREAMERAKQEVLAIVEEKG